MSAIAIAFHKKGWKVTGSDKGFYPPVSTHLKQVGISYYPGWHVDKMTAEGDPDVVVVGNVAASTNPEWQYVQKHSIPYRSYPDILAEYFIGKKSIVCAGTYGKTSTSALLSHIFVTCGKDPSYMFGGLRTDERPSAAIGDGAVSIMEGDEYKTARWDMSPKFSHYSPTNLLLTAVSWDHADIYPTEQAYIEAFTKLVASIPKSGCIVACTDHPGVRSLLKKSPQTEIITYGKEKAAAVRYADVKLKKNGLQFTIFSKHESWAITSPLLGEYMAANITGCFAMSLAAGLKPKEIIAAISSFSGLKRRLEKRYEGSITVFDDIAHSPEKAASALQNIRNIYDGKITAVFEPNTGNRKAAAIPSYDDAFSQADSVIIPRLTTVKKQKNDTDPPMDGSELTKIIKKTHLRTDYIPDDDAVVTALVSDISDGDVIVFLGSHGFRGMIEAVVEALQEK